jgi:hypothetical protein
LSTPERNAHDLLTQALPGYMIFGQVPLSRFIKVPTRYSYSQWLRRVGSHCVDLAVADPLSRVVAVIEVRSANSTDKAQRRRARVVRVLETANIPIFEWVEGQLPTLAEVRDLFRVTDSQVSTAQAGTAADESTPALVDPEKVSFYIATEALPEFPTTQTLAQALPDSASRIKAEEGEFPATQIYRLPTAASLEKSVRHAAFSSIDLDLPEVVSPSTSAAESANPSETSETTSESTVSLIAPSLEDSTESSTVLVKEVSLDADQATVLVEHMVHEEAVSLIPPSSLSALPDSDPLEAAESLDQPPGTWYGELDSQPLPLTDTVVTLNKGPERDASQAESRPDSSPSQPIKNWPTIEQASA